MTLFLRGSGGKVRQLVTQQCRGQHKWHSKKPRPKVIDRRVFEAVTVPILPEMLKKRQPYCFVEERNKWLASFPEEENHYEKFLIRQCEKMFDENEMIIWMHKLPMKPGDVRALRVLMMQNDYRVQFHNNEIMRKVVANSKWANLDSLLVDNNLFITSKEPRVKELLKLLKKVPQVIVMCGVVDNTILSKAGLERYATLPTMDVLLGQTVSTLNMSASKTKSLLSSHQEKLCGNLTQYIKDKQTGTEKNV